MLFFEKRKYERFDFSKELIISADNYIEQSKVIEYYARTINISRGGILFYTIAQFKERTKCIVKFRSNRDEVFNVKSVILRVITENRPAHLKPNEQMYALEFTKVFSHEELERLLDRPLPASS